MRQYQFPGIEDRRLQERIPANRDRLVGQLDAGDNHRRDVGVILEFLWTEGGKAVRPPEEQGTRGGFVIRAIVECVPLEPIAGIKVVEGARLRIKTR